MDHNLRTTGIVCSPLQNVLQSYKNWWRDRQCSIFIQGNKTTAASSREHWVPHTIISLLHPLSHQAWRAAGGQQAPAILHNPPLFTPAPAPGLRHTTTPGFLHGWWGFELWSSCLCGKHSCLLSHLPRTQQIHFLHTFPRWQSQWSTGPRDNEVLCIPSRWCEQSLWLRK